MLLPWPCHCITSCLVFHFPVCLFLCFSKKQKQKKKPCCVRKNRMKSWWSCHRVMAFHCYWLNIPPFIVGKGILSMTHLIWCILLIILVGLFHFESSPLEHPVPVEKKKRSKNSEICQVEGKVQKDKDYYTWTASVARVSGRCDVVNRRKLRRVFFNMQDSCHLTEATAALLLKANACPSWVDRDKLLLTVCCILVFWCWNLKECRVSPAWHVEIKMLCICYLCERAQVVLQQIFVALGRASLCAEPKISKSRIFLLSRTQRSVSPLYNSLLLDIFKLTLERVYYVTLNPSFVQRTSFFWTSTSMNMPFLCSTWQMQHYS